MFHNQMPSDDMSKMYTTLYDSEDPQQQQDFLQQRQYQESQQLINALLGDAASWNEFSPPSPASSCYSSSSSGSSLSSPVTGLRNIDSEDADELADLFHITIDDLLLNTPLSFAANMSLFESQQNMESEFGYMQTTTEAQQQHIYMQQQQQLQNLHNHGAASPCSSTMSPAALSTPFSVPTSPLISREPHPSPRPSEFNTNPDGTTVIKNEDGSIMVFNPSNDTVTFRCKLCPNESFGRIHDLKRHQTSKHQRATWPCEFCNRPFVRRDALLRHYTVKAARDDGIHPPSSNTEALLAARARAKLLG
ncbi:hypothetical protein FBU30_006915 [Linnemannia zychae]|nr:hypothetical protein FBU30_006915 [Linnemannia zychae]